MGRLPGESVAREGGNMSDERTVTYIETTMATCETCKGEGFVEGPSCSACGATFTDADIDRWAQAEQAGQRDAYLPCGHSWSRLREERECPDCEGTGVATMTRDVTTEVERLRAENANLKRLLDDANERAAQIEDWQVKCALLEVDRDKAAGGE